MNKKVVYLFLALALPGLIFIFLKFFGKNEFEVPVYFSEGIKPDSICAFSVQGPYQVPDSVMQKVGLKERNNARIVAVYPFIKDDLSEFSRMVEKYKSAGVESVILSGMPNLPKTTIPVNQLDYGSFGWIVTCGLRVAEPWSVVLIDSKNQIRGYYAGDRRDEMDRLDLELSIVLKKY